VGRLGAGLCAGRDTLRPDPDAGHGAGDLRQIGSGNIGATNVLRTGRKGLAASTLLLDMGKGVVAVVLARLLWGDDGVWNAAP
jgi:glycerol-3-phosphate acyltransferase PlsY